MPVSKTKTKTPTPATNPLQSAMLILQGMGESGKIIWRHGTEIKDMRERISYLRQAIEHIKNRIADPDMYHTVPVDVRTFIESPYLLNMADEVYPKIMGEIQKLCSGNYVEAVLTGGIGTGKTTIALIVIAYVLYEMSCMKDPHKSFGLAKSSEIVFIFQSLKKELAMSVDYKRFKAMVDNSPYFQEIYPYEKSIESEMQFPRRVIVKPLTGAATAAIGQNVFGGVIDEVNFMAMIENSKAAEDGGTFDQAREIYNSIARRRQSRFMKGGRLPGMLCLVSSKRYPGEFTDRKMEEAKEEVRRQGYTSIFIYDKRVWDVKPDGSFSGKWFHVFVGDENRKPRILNPGEELSVKAKDKHLVVAVPDEYRSAFNEDLLANLRDVAGVSTMALHPFILDTSSLAKCFGRRLSIASRDDVDFDRTQLQLYPRRIKNPEEPRFAHIDLASSRDSCGVSVGHVSGFLPIDRGRDIEMLPVINFDMILEIKPPRGGEIEFERVRRVIYALRDIGMRIKWVTSDTHQSKDTLQILSNQGFIVGVQSMDVDTTAYDVTKLAFYDERIVAPAHPKAQQEFARLERDPVKRIINHPPKGSKDVSDSMAGVTYGLTMRREIWARHGVSTARIPKRLIEREVKHKGSLSYVETLRQERHADRSGRARL